jgi:hypothetical protein
MSARARSMSDVVVTRFEQALETRRFPRGRFEILQIGGQTIGRATYEPGWRWSEDIGPALNATRCTSAHVGLVLEGAVGVAFDDGSEVVLKAGDLFSIGPIPHDSWVIGDRPYVSIHLLNAETYADASGRKPDSGTSVDS